MLGSKLSFSNGLKLPSRQAGDKKVAGLKKNVVF